MADQDTDIEVAAEELSAPPSPAKVEELISAMFDGAQVVAGYNVSELYSAALSLTDRIILVLIAKGADPTLMRQGVERLLLSCADPKRVM